MIQNEQVMHACMQYIHNKEIEAMNMRENRWGTGEGLEGEKEREKNYVI